MHFKKIHILVLILISLVVYSNTLKNEFTFDDNEIIEKNFYFKNIPAYKWLLNDNYFLYSKELSYRPIVTISYLINYYLFQLKPFGYHLTNLLLHICVVLVIYLFFIKITCNNDLAFITALIYSVHTISAEAVNSIGFREDILCALFFMIAFYSYINYSSTYKPIPLLISSVSIFLSLMSKEMGVTFFALIIVYDILFKKTSFDSQTIIRKYLPFLIIFIIYFLIRFVFLKNPLKWEPIPPEMHSTKRFFLIPETFCRYIFLLIFPIRLSAIHTYTVNDYIFHISFIPYLIILIGIVFISLYIKKYNPLLSFGLIFYLVSLLPVLNLIPITHTMAERYLYLPNIGFCFFLANLIFLIKNSKIRKILLLIILIFFSLLTYNRNKIWRDNESLWTATVKASPNSYRAHNGLGLVYYNSGELNKAQNEFETAIKLQPFYEEAYVNLGLAYMDKNELEKAISVFTRGIKLNPNNPLFHLNLGITYAKANMSIQAIDSFKKAAKLQPENPTIYNNWGLLYAGIGMRKEAIAMFKKAISLDSKYADAHFNLGTAYALDKRFKDAVKEYEITLKLNPMNVLAIKQLELAKKELRN